MNMTLQSSIKDKILVAQNEAFDESAGLQKGLDEMIELRNDEVIVDRLTKSVHFLPIREDFKMDRLARLYLNEIVVRHGVPISIISNCESWFTSRFWQSMQEALGDHLDMSTAYHPQTNNQSKRTIQTLKDMLRACILEFRGSWDVHLPLVEFFSYNNSYHSSVRCALFEASYGKKCCSLIMLVEVGEVSPLEKCVRFRNKWKLAPRFVGPFEIIKKVGPVAYKLDLPEELNGVHDTFHVSNLKKCLRGKKVEVEVNFHRQGYVWNSKRGPNLRWRALISDEDSSIRICIGSISS
ncbi:putative reverse transcriptase domain-containing protein [Tanacetum coccineum]|uniref:Reverse transcriptase domain-containing protein n=1 Tax=Tanacetum coccineum TaxID=301880 RepID=A0ABQ5HKG8_9ASTR